MDTKTFRILIFGGTTEGRLLSEYCAENGISADVSVATEYGASLLPQKINKLVGRLDAFEMTEVMKKSNYSLVIDATHPYALEVTDNIKKACGETDIPYYRLLRETAATDREQLSMEQMIERLNNSDKTILSTLGSNSLPELTRIDNYKSRVWLRLLPVGDIIDKCVKLGFDAEKIILKKGPFSVEENIGHIKKSGAEIIITKNSGNAGGYNEKIIAAEKCGIEIFTLARPYEKGFDLNAMIGLINENREGKA